MATPSTMSDPYRSFRCENHSGGNQALELGRVRCSTAIWGIGNNTYIALLALIPSFGFIWMLVLGAKGSAWAWHNGRWTASELSSDPPPGVGHIERHHLIEAWSSSFSGVVAPFSRSFRMANVRRKLSQPIAKYLVQHQSRQAPIRNVSVSGASGKAELNFSATGPKAAGVVFVEAVKKNGVWSITRLALKLNDSGSVIDLVGGARVNTT